jgi:hypothetical protein
MRSRSRSLPRRPTPRRSEPGASALPSHRRGEFGSRHERARSVGVERVVFDRAGFRYHGRIKSLADAIRNKEFQKDELSIAFNLISDIPAENDENHYEKVGKALSEYKDLDPWLRLMIEGQSEKEVIAFTANFNIFLNGYFVSGA